MVIGIGNPQRGDDAAGRLAATLIQPRAPAAVRVLECNGEATALLAALQGTAAAWLIDAAQSGAPPGTIHRIDCANALPLPRGPVSSHGFGLAEAIALGRALGTLPPHCIVYAIEAADLTAGAPPSAAVAEATHTVADRILTELTNPQQQPEQRRQ